MSKIMTLLEEKVAPVVNKIGAQRHLRAVRNGIISMLPLTIVGSFFVIFLNVPIPGYEELIAPIKASLDIPFRYTVGIMSIYVAFGIAFQLAKSYNLDELTSGFLAVSGFLISSVVPVNVGIGVEGVIAGGRWMPIAKLSASSLFGAILAAIISVEIYRFFRDKNIVIKMPDGVPPAVANSFAALFPAIAVILLFWVIRHILGFDISEALATLLSPLKGILAGNSLLGGLLTVFLILFFWVMGIHGPAILGPIVRPIWDTTIAENMDAFTASGNAHALPNIFTEQFLQWFLWIGGSGMTLPLVFLFMISKSRFLKDLGKLSLLPGIFNINEPVIFGAPIVMNPILAIPFIIVPVICTIISYILTRAGMIPMMMAKLPFTVPSPIGALISTNWSIMAFILVFINFFIGLVIYYPFFKIYEKQLLEQEKQAQITDEENII